MRPQGNRVVSKDSKAVRPAQATRPSPRAFTLVEVLVVMAIIVILASMVSVTATAYYRRAQTERTKATLTTLAAALESFRADYGSYPYHNPDGFPVEERPARPGDIVTNTANTPTYDIRNLYGLLRETGYLPEAIDSNYLDVEEDHQVKGNDYDHIVLDAWSIPLAYRYPRWDAETGEWREDRFDLWSMGADRRPPRDGIAEEFDPAADGTEADIIWGEF